jgi:thymidylate synthase
MVRFLSVYKDLKAKGKVVSPRKQKVLEIQDYMLTILRQPEGFWFSNYGQYWFGSQRGFDWVIDQLIKDKDSRQAVIPMLNPIHLFPDNKDVVCTESISFRIRENKLYMSVNMRSQDAMWGFTNDTFCFSILHEMVYVVLRDLMYSDLIMGSYTHKVDSFHVYERHFEMLNQIIIGGHEEYYEVDCPEIYDNREVINLVHYKEEDHRETHLFTEWLYENKYSDGSR